MKKYFTLYRRASSGPDVLEAYNVSQAIADYFATYFPDTYRVVEQSGRVDY